MRYATAAGILLASIPSVWFQRRTSPFKGKSARLDAVINLMRSLSRQGSFALMRGFDEMLGPCDHIVDVEAQLFHRNRTRGGSAEAVEANYVPVAPNILPPPQSGARLDCQFGQVVVEDRSLIRLRLLLKNPPAR